MGFLWVLGALAAGTLVAMLAGAILDYLQRLGWIVPLGEQWLLLPVVTGIAGLLASLISLSLYGRYLRERAASMNSSGTKAGAKSRVTTPKGMEDVPGMPTFDVEAIRQSQNARVESNTTAGARPTTPEQK